MWSTGLVHLFFFAAGVRNSIGVVFYCCLSRSEIGWRDIMVGRSLKRVGTCVGGEAHRIDGAVLVAVVLVLIDKTEH